uniref:Uncharacterized protein n=1 Tax=Thalassionema nitzschioides TaxID=33649 RepID=A0A7S1E3U2_9STRA|mmetsp:Transcript_7399/g.6100  ORF Transcript_7399/g.6100 Transcript_7399/m.6100 type:complete len:207 (+) Transcript_7399:98-718(+)
MKTALFLTLCSSAAAFAPSKQTTSTTSLNLFGPAGAPSNQAFASEVGAQAPLGVFDPAGVLDSPGFDKAEFDRLRWVELKHGRVAMLAVVGYLVTYAGVRFPGAGDIPAGFDALSAIPGMVWAQMIATWALMEAANSNTPGELNGFKPEFPGDFRNGALDFGWDKLDDAAKKRKRSIELNNGRAAQMGILGLMVHEKLGNVADILP